MGEWTSPIYVFFNQTPRIEYVNCYVSYPQTPSHVTFPPCDLIRNISPSPFPAHHGTPSLLRLYSVFTPSLLRFIPSITSYFITSPFLTLTLSVPLPDHSVPCPTFALYSMTIPYLTFSPYLPVPSAGYLVTFTFPLTV